MKRPGTLVSKSRKAFDPVEIGEVGIRPARRKPKKRPPPFSIRFSDDEMDQLRWAAGSISIAAYIRLKLFGDPQSQSKQRRKLRRKHYTPSAELAVIAQMLGTLGQSGVASDLSDIAAAAKTGALPLTPELERDVAQACAHIAEIRGALIETLRRAQ